MVIDASPRGPIPRVTVLDGCQQHATALLCFHPLCLKQEQCRPFLSVAMKSSVLWNIRPYSQVKANGLVVSSFIGWTGKFSEAGWRRVCLSHLNALGSEWWSCSARLWSSWWFWDVEMFMEWCRCDSRSLWNLNNSLDPTPGGLYFILFAPWHWPGEFLG